MTRFLIPFLLAFTIFGVSRTSDAAFIIYTANLSGPNEDPPNPSPGIGTAVLGFDTLAHTMRIQTSFSGLLGPTTVVHIHATTAVPGAGLAMVATQVPFFTGFPIGVTSGMYDMTFNTLLNSFYNPAFLNANGGTAAGAETALIAAIGSGRAYFNIHTTVFPGGEIRGFLSTVPEPSSLALSAIAGAIGLTVTRFRRRRTA